VGEEVPPGRKKLDKLEQLVRDAIARLIKRDKDSPKKAATSSRQNLKIKPRKKTEF
jgi:hypothetical protein